jgi:hypothetical protein
MHPFFMPIKIIPSSKRFATRVARVGVDGGNIIHDDPLMVER